jgi:transcriptional regulator with XRE-family HTH domain
MLREFVELRRLRLDRGWTYRKLAEEINRVSPAPISLSCLHGLLNDRKPTPNELTLDGIRKFLHAMKGRRRQERMSA